MKRLIPIVSLFLFASLCSAASEVGDRTIPADVAQLSDSLKRQYAPDKRVALFDVDYSKALESNMQLRHPSEMNSKRQRFFTNIKKGKRFKTAYRKCYPIMFYKQELKNILLKFGIMKTN